MSGIQWPEPDDLRSQIREQIEAELAELEKEIAWNERRLATLVWGEKEIDWNGRRLVTLVWGEDDLRQTEDYIADLKRVRHRLLAVLNG